MINELLAALVACMRYRLLRIIKRLAVAVSKAQRLNFHVFERHERANRPCLDREQVSRESLTLLNTSRGPSPLKIITYMRKPREITSG